MDIQQMVRSPRYDCLLGDLSKPKIVWGEISGGTKYTIDDTGHYYPEATTFFMSGKGLVFIVGFLNSSLSEYLFSKIGTTTGVGTVRWKKFKIEQLIVPHYNENLEQRIARALLSFSQKSMTAEQTRKALDEEFFKTCKISKEECEFVHYHPIRHRNPSSGLEKPNKSGGCRGCL